MKLAPLFFLYALTGGVFYLFFTTEIKTPADDITTLRLIIFLFMLPIFLKYAIQLLVAPFYKLIEAKFRHTSLPETPAKVSVMVPAWNEQVGIIKTIQSVINTHYKHLELVIINDGSTDQTHQLIDAFITNYAAEDDACSIKYLHLENGGKAKALNEGLKHASGEFIITIDADSVMDKNAIHELISSFSHEKVGAVAGNVIVGNRKHTLALLQQLEYLYGFFFKRADSIFNAVYIIGGAAAAYRKSVLDKVGGFDHAIITEDIEMSTRILAQGYKTRYASDAVIYTEGPCDWKGLCQQRLRWKFGRLLTFIKHKQLFFNVKRGNPYLCFLLLPVALYAELSLLFEALLLAVFYGYTIYTQDFLPLVCIILFMTAIISLQILIDSKARFHRNILCLAPIAWVVFYLIDVVELQALYRSLKRLAKRQNLEWQKWARKGLIHKSIQPRSQVNSTDNMQVEPLKPITGYEQNTNLAGGT